MKEENYKELIECDVIGAIIMFKEMSVPDRIKAVLYILDNLDVCGENVKTLLKDNVGIEMIKFIQVANKKWKPSDFEDGTRTNDEKYELANQKLIEEASEMYYEKHPEERPVEIEEVIEEIEEVVIEEEEIKNYYLLIK